QRGRALRLPDSRDSRPQGGNHRRALRRREPGHRRAPSDQRDQGQEDDSDSRTYPASGLSLYRLPDAEGRERAPECGVAAPRARAAAGRQGQPAGLRDRGYERAARRHKYGYEVGFQREVIEMMRQMLSMLKASPLGNNRGSMIILTAVALVAMFAFA